MHVALLFIDINDYKSKILFTLRYNNAHNIRLYLIPDIYCDYMFRLVNSNFEVTAGHFLS